MDVPASRRERPTGTVSPGCDDSDEKGDEGRAILPDLRPYASPLLPVSPQGEWFATLSPAPTAGPRSNPRTRATILSELPLAGPPRASNASLRGIPRRRPITLSRKPIT